MPLWAHHLHARHSHDIEACLTESLVQTSQVFTITIIRSIRKTGSLGKL